LLSLMNLRTFAKCSLQFTWMLSILVAIGAAASVYAGSSRDDMARAESLLEDGQYLEAVAVYQAVAEGTTETEIRAKAILRIGDTYGFFLNNYDLALNKYWLIKRDYAKTPQAETAYFNAGMIYYEKRQYKEALQQFNTYLQNYPRGDRKETAAFMVEACKKSATPPGSAEARRARTDDTLKKDKGNTIRVIIAANVSDIRLRADSPFTLYGGDGGQKGSGKAYREAAIRTAQGGLIINDTETAAAEITAQPSGNTPVISVNGKAYRGVLKIQIVNRNGLNVINILDIESYLYGVIPKEMSPQSPLEALKAQSVAARSFALYQRAKNKSKAYDVSASTGSQVYGGFSVESAAANRAVDETKGVVMMYKGQPALAYFHANSGGITEDARNVWTAEIPYLKSIADEPSTKAANIAWSASLSLDALKKALNNNGIRISVITKIRILQNSPSGRVTKIAISSPDSEVVMDGNDFRLKIDPAVIKSTLFAISSREDDGNAMIRFEGRGFGHGVGMSQGGALVMARDGSTYRDILSHYYQGVEIMEP
jgi:stage II sporulation protein D